MSWWSKKSDLKTDARPVDSKNSKIVNNTKNTAGFPSTQPMVKALPDISKPSTTVSKTTSARSAFFETKTSASSSSTSWQTSSVIKEPSNNVFKSNYASSKSVSHSNFTSSSTTKSISTSTTVTSPAQRLVKLSPFNREFQNDEKKVNAQGYVSPYRGSYRSPYLRTIASASTTQKPTDFKSSPAASALITRKISEPKTTLIAGLPLAKTTRISDIRPSSMYDLQVHKPQPLGTSQSHTSIPTSYSIAKSLRGYLIIFNQEEFKDPKMNREGSRYDEEALCRTFYNFGFDPNVKRNSKLSDIQSKVKTLTTKSFKEYGCFVAVILSHGTADETIFAYDKPFHLNKTIINPISTNPSLIGKPKIFIIATCRGDQQDQYFPKQGDRLETDSVPFTEQSSIPYYRDILKCYSTYEGFVSYRNPQKGTIFIQKFCDILNKNGITHSVEDIIKEVNKELTEGNNINKQVPTVVSTMSTSFCFGSLKRK